MKSGLAIIQYWDSEEIPDYVARLVTGFGGLNADLPHLVFSRPAAESLIAERFGARELAAFRACAVPAMQADYFRYCAVHALGGDSRVHDPPHHQAADSTNYQIKLINAIMPPRDCEHGQWERKRGAAPGRKPSSCLPPR